MITVPKRANRAVIASAVTAATAVAMTVAAPAAFADGGSQGAGKSGMQHGKVPAAKAAHPHKSNLKVTG